MTLNDSPNLLVFSRMLLFSLQLGYHLPQKCSKPSALGKKKIVSK